MGGRDFHDIGRNAGEVEEDEEDAAVLNFANSNEKAFVRSLVAGPDDSEARDKEIFASLDAYVLSGTIKTVPRGGARKAEALPSSHDARARVP